jgi:hypothetical protein
MGDYSQRFAISGLETLTINVEVAGLYTLAGKIQSPRLSQTDATDPNYSGYPSAVVTTIQQNSSTIFTSKAGADGFSIKVSCAVGDVITVALTSSAAEDEVLNAVRCVVSLG